MDVFRDLFSPLAAPLRGLLVALVGVLVAWLWFAGHPWWTLLALPFAALGLFLDWLGTLALPKHPVRAVMLMEGWLLTPAVIAALAAAALIVVAVELTVPTSSSNETKQVVAALSAGITAFVTTAFISRLGDKDDESVAHHVRRHFYASYQRAEPGRPQPRRVHWFRAESRAERLVYSDPFAGIDGWGWPARLDRARELGKELASKGSDP